MQKIEDYVKHIENQDECENLGTGNLKDARCVPNVLKYKDCLYVSHNYPLLGLYQFEQGEQSN